MRLICGHCHKIGEAVEVVELVFYDCKYCGARNETDNVMLREWLGFKYSDFLKSIIQVVKKDDFENLKANNEIERVSGYLTKSQVVKLKEVFVKNFEEGNSIRDIKKDIKEKVGIKDLLKVKDNDLVLDDGKPVIQLNSKERISMIARTETTRLASLGALDNYKDNNIVEVQFLSALSSRTCPECESLNGTIMSLSEAQNKIPVHVFCRCTWKPVVK